MFNFKQFTINQDKTAMKVGTDGVLLGAWAKIVGKRVLDIGTGTGLIALMIAQRSLGFIDSIEIDNNAYNQAKENFFNSKWKDRLGVTNLSLQNLEPQYKFDTIVSNPPFFNNSHKTPDGSRNLARHTDSLSFDDLLKFTSNNLTDIGIASFIIPSNSEISFLQIAKQNKLYPSRICKVRGHESTPVKRSLIELRFIISDCIKTSLTIEISRHVYTQDYINLTKDFYLKM